MKKIYFIIFYLIIFFTQCKKPNESLPAEDPQSDSTPAKKCILLSEKAENWFSAYKYVYNDKNQLQEIIWDTYPKDKGPFVFKYKYNDQGQCIERKSYTQFTNELLEKITFEYNEKDQLIKSIRESYVNIVYGYSKDVLNGTIHYEYNEKGQLVKVYSEEDAKEKWYWSQLFTYDQYDDLVRVEDKFYSQAKAQSITIWTYEYDHNQLALPFPPIVLNWFQEEYKFSKHFCKKALFGVNEKNGQFTYSKEFKIEKYTEEGYPEIINVITSGAINENGRLAYTYQCK